MKTRDCENCKWGKDPDLVKHGCWECMAPERKHFEEAKPA